MNVDDQRRRRILSSRVRRPSTVVYQVFPSETVVLNLTTGTYHGLNPTAGRMLELLDEGGAVGDAATRLASEFDRSADEVAADLAALCDDLVDRGLIELDEGRGG